MRTPERAWDYHSNGIHTECRKPAKPTGGAVLIKSKLRDGGTPDACMRAGTVDRWHTHDFDGPLWEACGCEDFGTE